MSLAAIVFFNVSGGPYGIEDAVPAFGPGLTLLLLIPSASATATPFEPSAGCEGIMAPWKSWLDSLRPLSECWPIEIFRSRAIRR